MDSKESELIKRKLIENVESGFPPEKAAVLRNQILSMSDEQLEKFVEKNAPSGEKRACIFCSLSSENAQTYKIGENDSAVAILEINPVSRGHALVLPKEHLSLERIPDSIKDFAQGIAEKMQSVLKSRDVEISSLNFRGHGVINLIPVYSSENIKSERRKATKEELEEVSGLFNKKTEIINKEPKKEKIARKKRIEKVSAKKSWLPKRIP
ncbi:MAG: HIT domain-containing protein [Candidatus Pacearchaeota archaeon]|nr:HIT domain-containing protein [Candidatus Pacearchaeota archaeon]